MQLSGMQRFLLAATLTSCFQNSHRGRDGWAKNLAVKKTTDHQRLAVHRRHGTSKRHIHRLQQTQTKMGVGQQRSTSLVQQGSAERPSLERDLLFPHPICDSVSVTLLINPLPGHIAKRGSPERGTQRLHYKCT